MHIQNYPTNFSVIDLSSSRADKAATAQRSADVRRKLMKRDVDIDPFESLMVSQEQEGGSRQRRSQNQQLNHANAAERPQPAAREQADQPLSFWA